MDELLACGGGRRLGGASRLLRLGRERPGARPRPARGRGGGQGLYLSPGSSALSCLTSAAGGALARAGGAICAPQGWPGGDKRERGASLRPRGPPLAAAQEFIPHHRRLPGCISAGGRLWGRVPREGRRSVQPGAGHRGPGTGTHPGNAASGCGRRGRGGRGCSPGAGEGAQEPGSAGAGAGAGSGAEPSGAGVRLAAASGLGVDWGRRARGRLAGVGPGRGGGAGTAAARAAGAFCPGIERRRRRPALPRHGPASPRGVPRPAPVFLRACPQASSPHVPLASLAFALAFPLRCPLFPGESSCVTFPHRAAAVLPRLLPLLAAQEWSQHLVAFHSLRLSLPPMSECIPKGSAGTEGTRAVLPFHPGHC